MQGHVAPLPRSVLLWKGPRRRGSQGPPVEKGGAVVSTCMQGKCAVVAAKVHLHAIEGHSNFNQQNRMRSSGGHQQVISRPSTCKRQVIRKSSRAYLIQAQVEHGIIDVAEARGVCVGVSQQFRAGGGPSVSISCRERRERRRRVGPRQRSALDHCV